MHSDNIPAPFPSQKHLDRFWQRVNKGPGLGPQGDCWEWRGTTRNRYGSFLIFGNPTYAHRASYQMHFGLAAEDVICHKCDNPLCVRPDHLFKGTQTVNAKDMWVKQRGSPPPHFYGEEHHMVTLSDAQVEELRDMAASGKYKQRDLAALFGVSQSTIWRIKHRITRKTKCEA